jgi:DNA modification methylase
VSTAELIIGPALDVVRAWSRPQVQSVITSPPYWRKRDYLEAYDPAKADEWGQEPSPAAFLDNLLDLTDALWDVVADDGTIWFNLGDTAGGSGGPGGDYLPGGWHDGQPKWEGTAKAARPRSRDTERHLDERRSACGPGQHTRGIFEGFVRDKSVCWLPDLFGASLAYGWNMLRPERKCRQWITRPPVTWCKPNPTPGEIIDKFREATELVVWASKQRRYYFDLDAIRLPIVEENQRGTRNQDGPKARAFAEDHGLTAGLRYTTRSTNPKGAPPLNWWPIAGSGYDGAHFATFPPELIIRPVIASCPPGGTILDPFVGSGTTLAVATGHGRNAIGIDLDHRNEHLIRHRVGMFLVVA